MEKLSQDMLRIAGVVKESTVDGPGFRYVIFTQGCPHHCEGCHNPQTHDFEGGKLVSIDKIVADIKKNPLLKGITLSGGEPFMQANQLANLVSQLEDKYTVMAYTGFKFEYLIEHANEENGYVNLLEKVDVLIDGKFEQALLDENLLFRGSQNQRAIRAKESITKEEVILHEF